jgi:glycosyltransferase involved in cell wall biosynthesis
VIAGTSPAGSGSPEVIETVSAVIPAFNAQDHLAPCLASIQGQTGAFELEVIVVDDGSSDDTADIALRHPGIKLIRQNNRGPGAARNAGIAASHGRYIAFLDADDLWPEGKLAAQLKVLRRQPGAALVFGDCRQFDERAAWPQTLLQADEFGASAWGGSDVVPDAYTRLLEDNFITTGSVVMRRDVLTEVGGFAEDLRLVEDLELWLRVALRHPIAWCPQVGLLRRRHANNTSRDAEAMSLAFLEVLRRQHAPDGGTDVPVKQQLRRLAAKEHLHIATLAIQRRNPGLAVKHAWLGLVTRPSARALGHLGRALVSARAKRLRA